MFHHLAWWPWYMRTPLRDSADRIGRRLFKRKKSPDQELENLKDNLSSGEHKESSASDARRGERD
jgi:hypothetical protein